MRGRLAADEQAICRVDQAARTPQSPPCGVTGLGWFEQATEVSKSPVIRRSSLADLERLARLVEAGELTPTIEMIYPMDQAPEAMRHLQAGQVRGKVVITVAQAR